MEKHCQECEMKDRTEQNRTEEKKWNRKRLEDETWFGPIQAEPSSNESLFSSGDEQNERMNRTEQTNELSLYWCCRDSTSSGRRRRRHHVGAHQLTVLSLSRHGVQRRRRRQQQQQCNRAIESSGPLESLLMTINIE
ncbi:hypothetical protein BLOT_003211 [Blomia tropicalis]|nr:hypothetical protein BLOT_003211 [Blomia tropicalis]